MFRKSKIHNDINYLQLVPLRLHEYEIEEDGKVSVLVPRFGIKLLQDISTKFKKPYVKAKLDKFGSQTWLAIDGEKNVQQIIDTLRNHFGKEIEPAEERVTKFLTQLFGYKFISFNELITRRS